MRLIGNKSRLLGAISGFLRDRGVEGGTFIDIFCGTASVGKHFKSLGFQVIANDRLSMCHSKAVANIEVSRYPSFEDVMDAHGALLRSKAFESEFSHTPDALAPRRAGLEESTPLAKVIHLLDRHIEPVDGIMSRQYSPAGPSGRMYFTVENARRIDGILQFLRENYCSGLLSREEMHLLLSALLDAADRVANISGTYGAYLKKWQRNALLRLSLAVPRVEMSRLRHRAIQRDANEVIRELKGDVLYIDPPYNHRQYAANYHVLEIIAEHHKVEDLDAYETSLYGKTGLRPYEDLKSAYCVPCSSVREGGNVESAMRDLILSSDVAHVVVSYNEEGLLTREELGTILSRFAGTRSFDFAEGMRSVLYKRFCSDSDRPAGESGAARRYKVVEGKRRGEISEWLFYASRRKSRARPRRRRADASRGPP